MKGATRTLASLGKSAGYSAVLAGLSLLAPGCAVVGTVIVDFAIAAEVTVLEVDGRAASEPGVVKTLPRAPRLLSPFDSVQFSNELFEWTFGTGTLGLGGQLANRGVSTLCFKFDKARIGSNFHQSGKPLRVSSWRHFEDGNWSVPGSTRPEQRQHFVPPALCLGPGQVANFSFAPDLLDLFPSQKLFNVAWLDGAPVLVTTGVGSWIRLSLPIEDADTKRVVDVVLTATDSKARLSYY